MFPYKVRKPAWGSLKPKSSQQENDVITQQLGGDPSDCQTIGGYLQRAILFDLVELRQRYLDVEVSASSVHVANIFQDNNNHAGRIHQAQDHHHAALGSSFARFKACFREARFAAIHTRTIPPRVDRGEYVQLLYSSCLHLLEQAFQRQQSSHTNFRDDESLSWDHMNSGTHQSSNSALNAIYAVFMLYTLHKTNVLPEAPSPRSCTERMKSGNLDEQSLKEAWSMLPIGINSDEDKLYRRTYLTGVRIDRWNYLLLVRLRDVCLARVNQCSVDMMGNQASRDSLERQCHCGLAKDAARIIDRMLFDEKFFQYCEYHGPHSLEGMAGSGNYYNAYFHKPPKKKSKQTKSNSNTLGTAEGLLWKDLKSIGSDDELLDMQNLSMLIDSHRSNLSTVMAQMQKSRQTGGDLQPKQRERVENALSGVEESATYLQLIDDGSATNNDMDVGESSAIGNDVKQTNFPVKVQSPEAEQGLRLSLSDTVSPALHKEVRFLLPGLMEDAEVLRRSVVKGNKATMRKDDNMSVDLNEQQEDGGFRGFEDFDTIASQQQNHVELSIGGDLLSVGSAVDIQQGKKRRRKEIDGSIKKEDEVSVATGAGRNALLSLLSMAKGDSRGDDDSDILDEEDELSLATGAGKNALLSLLTMAKDKTTSDQEDESLLSDIEERSYHSTATAANSDGASGMGRQALNFLLSQSNAKQQSQKVKARPRKRTPQSKTGNKRKSEPAAKNKRAKTTSRGKRQSNDQECEDADDDRSLAFSMISEGEGAGKNALESLLSKATKSSKMPRAVTKKIRPNVAGTAAEQQSTAQEGITEPLNGRDADEDKSLAFSMASEGEGAGKNALASLLASATNVEEV